jgi:N-acetylglutamate synthase
VDVSLPTNRALTVSDAWLEEIAAHGWRASEADRLGDWLLRASGGFTGRANSALAVGDPGLPRAVAIARVVAWYSARGLPARFMVPLPLGADLDDELAERGWQAGDEVRVLVADLAGLTNEPASLAQPIGEPVGGRVRIGEPTGERVRIDSRPDPGWLAAYHYRGAELPDHAVDVLVRGDVLGFASVRDETGRVRAIARGSVDKGWLGITAVEVDPADRRQGLGGVVLRALARWAVKHGASQCYLQVAIENAPALALYTAAGFTDHHRYRYRILRQGSRNMDDAG